METRTEKIEYLKKVLGGENSNLNRDQFEIWKGTDSERALFENTKNVRLSREEIEANTANGKGALNNIYIIRPHQVIPLADSENTVIT